MKTLLASLTAIVLTSPAWSQSLTREYRQVRTRASAAVSSVQADADVFGLFGWPRVDAGPFVRATGVGYRIDGRLMAEVEFANGTGAPVTVPTPGSALRRFVVVGSQSGCGFGSGTQDSVTMGGAPVTVPADSTRTVTLFDSTFVDEQAVGETLGGPSVWPCVLSNLSMNASFGASAINVGAPGAELRARVEVTLATVLTVELLSNPDVTSSCPGPPNSLGVTTALEYFGSTDAGTRRAAVRLSDVPAGVPAVCIVTNAFASTPLGVGVLPNLCLRGVRTGQEVRFTEPLGTAGEAIFDIDLMPFAPGETFAIQVGHREPGGGASTSNMLVGTAR